jgi:hypothetical protein
MWAEVRHVLSLIGDETVTIVAFAGLLLYSLALLVRGAASDRLVPVFILCIAASWLYLVIANLLTGDLARWSPLAVILFAIGTEHRAHDNLASPPRPRLLTRLINRQRRSDINQPPSPPSIAATDAADLR